MQDVDADNEVVMITYEVDGPGDYAGLSPDEDVLVTVEVIDDDAPPVLQPERELVEDTVRTITATTVSNITTNIGARFSAARGGTSLTSLSLAGQSVTCNPRRSREWEWNSLWNEEGLSRTLSSDDLLRSTDFQIVLGASESTHAQAAETWTFWGRGDLQYFSSQPSQWIELRRRLEGRVSWPRYAGGRPMARGCRGVSDQGRGQLFAGNGAALPMMGRWTSR